MSDWGFEDLGHIFLKPPFEKRNDGECVRIMQLTDLHIFPKNTRQWISGRGKRLQFSDRSHDDSLQILTDLVKGAQPDLVILTGDILDGRGPWESSTSFIQEFEAIADSICGVQWAFIPGNHDDDQSPWQRSDLLKVFGVKNCVQAGAKGFDHTFTVSVADSDISSARTTRLFLYDSGGNHPDKTIKYYTVSQGAVEGLRRFTMKRHEEEAKRQGPKTKKNKEVALVYLHIPLPQYENLDPVAGRAGVFEAALAAGMVPAPWQFVPALLRALGKHRVVGCSRASSQGLFSALSAEAAHQPETEAMAVFCGHDHHSDAIFWRDPLFLCYGRCASVSPPRDWEGSAPNPLAPGARVVAVPARGFDLERAKATAPIVTWIQTREGEAPSSRIELCFQQSIARVFLELRAFPHRDTRVQRLTGRCFAQSNTGVRQLMMARRWTPRGIAAVAVLLLAVAVRNFCVPP